MLRLILGLIKGSIVGGLVGYGAYALGLRGGFHWVTYGVAGAMVGLVVGRPIWSHLADKSSTMFTSLLKAIVGFGVGVGLYALVAKAWGGFDLAMLGQSHKVFDWQFVMGGAIGAVYGGFVEVDDAPVKGKPAAKPAASKK